MYLKEIKNYLIKILLFSTFLIYPSLAAMAINDPPETLSISYSDGIDDMIIDECLKQDNKKINIKNKADGQLVFFKTIKKNIGESIMYTRIPIKGLMKRENKVKELSDEKTLNYAWSSNIKFDIYTGIIYEDKDIYDSQYIALEGNFNLFSLVFVLVFAY